tara:strand:+ start:29794 stop:31545 length:1752 start_codon:yes stop_codon:yes gene_type:complete
MKNINKYIIIKKKTSLIILMMLVAAFIQNDLFGQINKSKTSEDGIVFPYRGWSIAVLSNDKELEERYVAAATRNAKEYRINTLEIHDYVMPGGIIDALITYDAFSKINHYDTLTYGRVKVSKREKDLNLERFKRMIEPSHKEMKINVWYHVMRDLPKELAIEYPQIQDIRSGFLWTFIDSSLTEFFRKVPEVDRITLISLHETPSILNNLGGLSSNEVLLKLYMTIYKACHRAGKELIIRDFIDTYKDYQTFWNILDQLPQDIYIMTKCISGDWSHLDMAINPMMNRYKNHKLIVEFDLYGEWSGRGDFPVCYPEYIIRLIREMKGLDALGAVGRIIHDSRPADKLPFNTIFDSPLDINCFTFAKSLSEPLSWLGETDPKWNEDIEAIDKKDWMIWAKDRYGDKAAMQIVRALERTSSINKLTFDLAGISFRLYIWYPTLFRTKPGDQTTLGHSWDNFQMQVQNVGIEYLRDEKNRALELAFQSLNDIKSLENRISKVKQQELEKLFDNMILIIKAYQVALDGYYQVYVAKNQPNLHGLEKASKEINNLADEIDVKRGSGWYFNLTKEMRVLSGQVLEGLTPD